MKNGARWHGVLALLLTLAVAACGSQSQANEADAGESGQPSADVPAEQAEPSGQADAEEAPTAAPAEEKTATRSREEARTGDRTSGTPSTSESDAYDGDGTSSEDVPTTSAREEPADEEPAPAMATVAAGTSVSLTLDQKLSTENNQKGDAFTATVTKPVIEGSRVLIPEGATVRGTITAMQAAEGDKPPMLTLDFESIEVRGGSSPLAATLTSANVKTDQKMKGKGKKIGGGAAAGGLVGGLLGGDVKGALIGAAVGSAAGTAITLATQEGHAILPEGTPMEIRVDESLDVRI